MTQVDGMQDSDGERNDIANTLVISHEQSKRQGWNGVGRHLASHAHRNRQ